MRHLSFLLLALSGALVAACESPVQDDLIDALPPDDGPNDEFHRRGQPCLLCHDSYYGEGPEMSVGGTIFGSPTDPIPVGDAVVTITDSSGETKQKTTNCAGNFWWEKDEWLPSFPLRVVIECPVPGGGQVRAVMGTRVGRDGSCAGCHTLSKATVDSPGWVYCKETDPGYEIPDSCEAANR